MSDPRPTPPRSRLRWAWWLLAYVALGLGLVGIVVPGLPTVPFVLLSAYAAARGSERLHRRLLADRRFGPMIDDWQRHGAVARRAKWFATATMAASPRRASRNRNSWDTTKNDGWPPSDGVSGRVDWPALP